MLHEQPSLHSLTIYGDSISTTNYGNGGYQQLIQASLSIHEIQNHAVSGSSLSTVQPNNGISIMQAHPPAPDTTCILLWYGTNDWYWGAPAGELHDIGTETFLGAMNRAVDYLHLTAPKARLVWLTPLYRLEAPNGSSGKQEAYTTPNRAGATLLDIHQAVTAGCRFHGIPVIDMHALCNIHRYNASLYLEDGAHPNEAGYGIISAVLCKYLRQLFE